MNEETQFKTEEQLQAACFKWFDETYPEYRRTLFSVPNGGERPKKFIPRVGWVAVEANKLVATGLQRGVSDLIWVVPVNVIFIEMKMPNGRQSPEQIDFMNKVRLLGHEYVIIFSLWRFREFIKCKIQEYYGKV